HLELAWFECLLLTISNLDILPFAQWCIADRARQSTFQHLHSLSASTSSRVSVYAPADKPEKEGGDEAECDNACCNYAANCRGRDAIAVTTMEDARGLCILRICEAGS